MTKTFSNNNKYTGEKLVKSSNLSDLTDPAVRTNLSVDVAGTDNSTNVTYLKLMKIKSFDVRVQQILTARITSPISLGGTGTNTLNDLISLGIHSG